MGHSERCRGNIALMYRVDDRKREPWLLALLGVLVMVPFVADLMFPLGTAISVVYLLAIAISFFVSKPVMPFIVAVLSTASSSSAISMLRPAYP